MRYILSFLLPPVALMTCRYYVSALLNGLLWVLAFPAMVFGLGFLMWAAAAIHAVLMVGKYYGDQRTAIMVAELQKMNNLNVSEDENKEGPTLKASNPNADNGQDAESCRLGGEGSALGGGGLTSSVAKKPRFGPDGDGIYRID